MHKRAVRTLLHGSLAPLVPTNPPEGITPAAMAQIAVALESRKGLGISSAAIQQRGGRAVAFVVADAQAMDSRNHPNKVEAMLFKGLATSPKGKSSA